MIKDTPANPLAEQAIPLGASAGLTDDLGASEPHGQPGSSVVERAEPLRRLAEEARDCTRCPQLAGTRTHVVFGSGPPEAELMLIGEAPGAREDEQGQPFVGASGRLLDELLASIGLTRADVYVTNTLKCRPPGNRDPAPGELERCRGYLDEQIQLVRPRVIATLGNAATRALRGRTTPITELHGRPEVVTVAGHAAHLLPLFHPAAALYTRPLLDTLREDFTQLAELLALPAPEAELDEPGVEAPIGESSNSSRADEAIGAPGAEPAVAERARDVKRTGGTDPDDDAQLGLF